MKRNLFAVAVCALLCAALLCACGKAAEPVSAAPAEAAAEAVEQAAPAAKAEPLDVYVTISDAGKLVVPDKLVTAEDFNEDGAITLCDALYAAHEEFYDGGASAGFEAIPGDYGTNIAVLWGSDNGGSYGYYLDAVSAMNLDEPLTAGCHVTAYSFADLEAWSDAYSFFSEKEVSLAPNETFTLKLSVVSFDENWNPVTAPLAGAGVTVNDIPINTLTGEDGSVLFSFPKAGEYVISAFSDELTLVPPVCVIEVA